MIDAAKADLTQAIVYQPPRADADLIKNQLDELDNQPSESVPQLSEADLLPLYDQGVVPRIKYGDVTLLNYLKAEVRSPRIAATSINPHLPFQLPVIMTEGKICGQAPSKWSFDYLEQHMGDKAEFSVFRSDSNRYDPL